MTLVVRAITDLLLVAGIIVIVVHAAIFVWGGCFFVTQFWHSTLKALRKKE